MILTNKNSSGFTLTELLVAITMTGILVTGSTVGITTMMQRNTENERRVVRRQETNRALELIAEEIKMAETIANDPENEAPEASEIPSDMASNEETILVLTIPDVADPVVYRIAQPADSTVWEGPRVIYRWGPNFNSDGTYDLSSWGNNPLVDRVAASNEEEFSAYCNQTGVVQKIPDAPQGFYLCLEGEKVTEVVIRSSEGEIKTRMKAFARSASVN